MNLKHRTHVRLQDWRAKDLYRTIAPIAPGLINFGSSDYLGLSEHPEVLAASRAQPAGSTGSRLTTGTFRAVQLLEAELAAFQGFEDAIFFPTGYQCNVSVLQALGEPDVTIFSDAANHASLIDGARLAKAQVRIYPHLDYATLANLLAARDTPHALVVSDGMFSMSGELADLGTLRTMCDAHDAWLLIDDAHSVGTIGATGRGSVELFDAHPDVLIGTASKALGVAGGYACAEGEVTEWLRQKARGFVFSTAPTPGTVEAVRAALGILQENPHLVERLRGVAAALNGASRSSPIVTIPVGSTASALQLSDSFRQHGFYVPAIRYPTVPRDGALLRMCARANLDVEAARAVRELISQTCSERAGSAPRGRS